ncbi:hypothetical protein RND81_09G084300 [Saponaria officinalis]|uniref:Amidohydrolase-related domain-containing protein n=1 Tax=Saponaria officinalis TaxID=3572 RepID=A0AAW1IJ85_SAPOF
MATINGAKTVLWDSEIGSLEVGKKADIVIIDPCSWTMVPVNDRKSRPPTTRASEDIHVKFETLIVTDDLGYIKELANETRAKQKDVRQLWSKIWTRSESFCLNIAWNTYKVPSF